MAIVTIPSEDRTVTDQRSITSCLSGIGISYERWNPPEAPVPVTSAADILLAYRNEIEALKIKEGYAAADVIDICPWTPGLDAMLAKFSREHWHDDDEVRFVVHGRGLFHIHPQGGPVTAIEVESGDFIRVPGGTWHWFDLCGDRTIQAIRLFKDPAGWVPRYTDSGVDRGYQPVCFGPSYVAFRAV